MAKKRYFIPGERLKILYCEKKLTTFQIAEIFNCTPGTIVNRMKECDIKRRRSGPKRIGVSRKTLHSLYIEKGFSAGQIAKICHCERTAIFNKLHKYKLAVRHPTAKINISKKVLKDLYEKQGFSAYKIAEKFNCVTGTIYRYLGFYGIKTRPLKRLRITEKRLRKLYVEKRLSLSEIARGYGCSSTGILKKMKQYNIPRRSISEASTIHPKNNFIGSLAEKSYLIGFRIGDLRVKKRHSLISVGCGTTKSEQVKLIRDLFSPYGPVWIGKKDKRGAVHIGSLLNSTFTFLIPKHHFIPKWILRNKKSFLSFLAGYADAEGNIGVYAGRAKFRLRSYDKGVLEDINKRLNHFGIKSLFRLEKKKCKGWKNDCWGVTVNERRSLLKLFEALGPLLRHEKRRKDLLRAKKNVVSRLKIKK